jgi:Fe-S oxidoreductase
LDARVRHDRRPMSTRLPALDRRADATRACSFCPKLCRPACPVATVTGNDALSAWGIMNTLDPVARGATPSSELLQRAFACTGCGHCRAHCELDNPVEETLREARALAFVAQQAPPSVRAWLASIERREARLRDHARQLGARTERPLGTVLFAGCSLVATDVSRVAAIHRALERWIGEVSIVADLCCGSSCLEAGDVVGFHARAEALADRLRDATQVLTLDAGCAHATSTLASRREVSARAMEPIERFFERRLDALPSGALASMGSFAVHDACRSGRGMAVYDAPRAIVRKLTGRAPIELRAQRERALCSGGGGLLPITHRATSDAIADELAAMVRESCADHVVTSCPTSRARLSRCGLSAYTVADLLVEAARTGAAPR